MTITQTSNANKSGVPTPGSWTLDPAHSEISIIATHLMVTKVRGHFTEIEGSIQVADDPSRSTVEVTAKAASIDTGSPDRDAHLRSGDFLDAEQYPLVSFRSTSLASEGESWKLSGDLTIRDVTQPVVFDLRFDGMMKDPFGNQKAAFFIKGEIERELWGLTWNVPLEAGGLLVSKKFKLEISAQAVLKP